MNKSLQETKSEKAVIATLSLLIIGVLIIGVVYAFLPGINKLLQLQTADILLLVSPMIFCIVMISFFRLLRRKSK